MGRLHFFSFPILTAAAACCFLTACRGAPGSVAGDLAALEHDVATLGSTTSTAHQEQINNAKRRREGKESFLDLSADDEAGNSRSSSERHAAVTRRLVESCAAGRGGHAEVTIPARALRIKIHEVYRHGDGTQVAIALPIRTCRYHVSARGGKLVVRSRIYVDYVPDESRADLEPRLEASHRRMVEWFAKFGIVLDVSFEHDQGLAGMASSDCEIGFRDDGTRGVSYNYKNWALSLDGGEKFSERERAWTFCHELLHYLTGAQEEYTISGADADLNDWPRDSIMRSHYDGSYPEDSFPVLYPNHFRRIFATFCPNADDTLPGINTDVMEMGRNAANKVTKAKDEAKRMISDTVDTARGAWDNFTSCHCSGDSFGDYKPTFWTQCKDWDNSGEGDWCYTKGSCASATYSKTSRRWYKFC